MWKGNNKTWIQYNSGILAADDDSARFLSDYIRFLWMNRINIEAFEVIDLQKYKLVRSSRKVLRYINECLDYSFVFLSCNN